MERSARQYKASFEAPPHEHPPDDCWETALDRERLESCSATCQYLCPPSREQVDASSQVGAERLPRRRPSATPRRVVANTSCTCIPCTHFLNNSLLALLSDVKLVVLAQQAVGLMLGDSTTLSCVLLQFYSLQVSARCRHGRVAEHSRGPL